ncbi:MAG TPA: hypothetical protein VF498_01025 [Anaerolineales bacterium]
MLQSLPLYVQAAVFSSLAGLIILVSAWWLYLSPVRFAGSSDLLETALPPTGLAIWMGSMLGLSSILFVSGALWDASMHIQTGEIPAGADFLWPPHLMLYSGFLLAFLVTLLAMFRVAVTGWSQGERDLRRWVRRNPYLGAVALASLFEMLAIPGDALWHEIFGVDLTAWSPPHILLALMSGIVIICAVGVLVQARFSAAARHRRDAAVLVLLGLLLNMFYIVGVLEWELPDRNPLVSARPIWLYPVVGGAMAFFTLALARRLVQFRWAATATALVFYLVRLAATLILGATGNIAPSLPLVFLLGAVLMDALPFGRLRSGSLRDPARAAAFAAGYYMLALPILTLRSDLLKTFGSGDFLAAVLATFLVCLVLQPITGLAAEKLLGRQVAQVETAAADRQPLTTVH